jgi:hypothetical protein
MKFGNDFAFISPKLQSSTGGPWLLGAPALYIKEMFLFLFSGFHKAI